MLNDLHIDHKIRWIWCYEFATEANVVVKQVIFEPKSVTPRSNYYIVGSNKELKRDEFHSKYKFIREVQGL
jgi:hypothetical protein